MKNILLLLVVLPCYFEVGDALEVPQFKTFQGASRSIRYSGTMQPVQESSFGHHQGRSGMRVRGAGPQSHFPRATDVSNSALFSTTAVSIDPAVVSPLKEKIPSILHTQKKMLLTFLCGGRNLVSQMGRKSLTRKKIILLLTFCVTIMLLIDTIQTKKRQREDPTSEWGRYADHPSIRGRALFSLMGRISTMMIWAKIVQLLPGTGKSATHTIRSAGETFAEGLLRLGPLYIKIGQILSCRKNLLPEEWKSAMERLQDRVPAKSGQEALDLAYSSYNDNGEEEFQRVFKEFDDQPLAAASLGQVHKATLRSNDKIVAIKLQRPRLRDIYDKDLALMNKIAKAVDTFGGKAGEVGGVKQSWEEIFRDAEEILYREIDYRDEAENAKRFAESFGLGVDGKAIPSTSCSLDGKVLPSASTWLRTPYVYDEYSTERILVMEYVPSIKISDDVKLKNAGVSSEDKEALAESLARSYLRQFVCGKFFSTDPHAGNLGVIVDRDENGKKKDVQLVFYDFGQACSLKDDQAAGILNVIEGIMDYDVDKCVDAFIQMGVLADDADLDKVRRKVKDNFESGKIKVKQRKKKRRDQTQSAEVVIEDDISNSRESSNSNTSIKTAETDDDSIDNSTDPSSEKKQKTDSETVNDAEIMSYFTLPAEYAFVARAISQMDGVGKNLDTDFDFISAAAPWIVEIKGGERYLQDEFQKIVKKTLQWQGNLFKAAGFRSGEQ